MHTPNSPWLQQLKREINHKILDTNLSTQATVIGAGISGISTIYYLLKKTNLDVVLLEGFKVGHGASGHNAGQVVGYFEKDFTEIISEFGETLAIQAQKDVFSSWDKLEEMIDFADLKTPLSKFIGYAGCQTHEQLINHLEKKLFRDGHGIQIDGILIDKNYSGLSEIPKKYSDLYQLVDQDEIKKLLNTESDDFIACLATHKGTLNSSLFCEEMLGFLMNHYKERLRVYEHSQVQTINLFDDKIILDIKSKPEASEEYNHYAIETKKIVLCTNGYKNFQILDFTNQTKNIDSIDKEFKSNLIGTIGYMGGYLEKELRNPTAISYFPKDNQTDVYFYLTRRKYEYLKSDHTLTCVGGPEERLPEQHHYDNKKLLEEIHTDQIQKFLKSEYSQTPKDLKLDFAWHGLMGYTKNLLRIIGPDKHYPNLMYNLGCNGIGILPSIFGGWKISQFVNGNVTDKSIFDPV